MYKYEFRVLNEDHTECSVTEEIHLDNYSAIRSARRLAVGRPFQVWLGLECIFGIPHEKFEISTNRGG